jgi:tetratricopeptide (TPR) repeat protein
LSERFRLECFELCQGKLLLSIYELAILANKDSYKIVLFSVCFQPSVIMSSNYFLSICGKLAIIAATCSAVSLSFAQVPDDSVEIGRLIRNGQTDQAAARVESALANKPNDAQLRFLRGVVQIEQRKINDAIVTFQRMTEDFPELPEPYNNLAVLYAGQAQYDKARAALELAIRTHPSYATAHENLGDVYTKMASASYSKALQLDAGNNAAQIKLNVIKDLSSAKAGRPPAPAAAASAPIAAAAPVAVAIPSPPPAVVPTPVATVKPAPVVKPVAVVDESDAAYDAVVAWAKAWGAQNVDTYLASYAKAFTPPSGESRKAWEKERRARIEGKRSIAVSLESPTVTVTGDAATVKFRQVYQADSLSTSTRKTLKLSKTEGSWKIIEEIAGR